MIRESCITLCGGNYDYSVITVEHVLPQNPSADSKWLQWFPNEEERIQYVHRIGNLALLSRNKNAEAQNYDFNKKKEKYFFSKKGVSPFVLTTQVLHQSEWTPEVIKLRQEDCLQSLRKLWRL
ncbi:MAG: HNH endonuclease family protein [Nostoc sp. DedQUE11]|nr:HNH endonuclease family protein [Nostoc sp. DedQUE11]